jgi:DNA-directed RNA polymerase subunit omega
MLTVEITQEEYDRLKVEDCYKTFPNRFELILAAGQRVRQLQNGHKPTIKSNSRENVTALREIAAGNFGRELLRGVGKTKEA